MNGTVVGPLTWGRHICLIEAQNVMPKWIQIIVVALSLSLATAPLAVAQPTRQEYIVSYSEFLAGQGFEVVRISKTFLGRIRLNAESADFEREMIINPHTGEVLRDVIVPRGAAATFTAKSDARISGSNSSSGFTCTEDSQAKCDKEEEDYLEDLADQAEDDAKEDNSGSGSSDDVEEDKADDSSDEVDD